MSYRVQLRHIACSPDIYGVTWCAGPGGARGLEASSGRPVPALPERFADVNVQEDTSIQELVVHASPPAAGEERNAPPRQDNTSAV